MTFLKLSPSFLCMFTRHSYTLMGVEPVARPSTALLPCFCRCLIRLAISWATYFEAFWELSWICVAILSNFLDSSSFGTAIVGVAASVFAIYGIFFGLEIENTKILQKNITCSFLQWILLLFAFVAPIKN